MLFDEVTREANSFETFWLDLLVENFAQLDSCHERKDL